MKFRFKVTCCMIILMALFFGFGSSALISITFQNSLQQEMLAAQDSYHMILNTLQIVNSMNHWTKEDDIADIVEQLFSQGTYGTALQLHSQTGTLYSKGSAIPYFKDLSKKADNTHLASTVFSMPDGTYHLQLSGTFLVVKEIFYLDISYDISSIYQARTQQLDYYRQIFVILLMACAIFSYILVFLLTRPLSRLSKASREISSGNYAYRCNVRSNDEIGTVSRDFDQMAAHLQDSVGELQESVERQNQFVGNFTHELKTPMTSIIGYADLLRSQTLSAEDQIDAANYIFSEGKRLERLSLKLLDIFVSGHDSLSLAAVSPADIIQSQVCHLRPVLAQEQIQITCTCEPGLCMLDSDLFTSLLVNLIENARKALLDPGSDDNDPKNSPAGTICVSSSMTGEGCRITVSDNGRGIPADALAHITEAFYRVDKARARAHGGAGLGLTLCAEIARLHGGMISFESEEGKGTTVTVLLYTQGGQHEKS